MLLEEAADAGVKVDAIEENEDCELMPGWLLWAACWAGPPKREETAAGVDGWAIADIGLGGVICWKVEFALGRAR